MAEDREQKNGLEDLYIIKNNKRLRYGFTTGSCAAAAAKAAAMMLFGGNQIDSVELMTPKGILLHLSVQEVTRGEGFVSCAIRKDSGDDPDVTNGMLVFAKVSRNSTGTSIEIDGGIGVGRVTKTGLEQPKGSAAINRVPRQMIAEAVQEICEANEYAGGIKIEISIPGGEEIAARTFNPKLGIEGGISILGTSGIVEPMSEAALIESIRVEMRMLVANGARYLLLSPGNYGVDFTRQNLSIPNVRSIKFSNYVGETLDMAAELGVSGVLFISHIGKFVKVAGGIMNTHSKVADARMEILAANAAMAGANSETIREVLACTTTDEGIDVLEKNGLTGQTMTRIIDKIQYYLEQRVSGAVQEITQGALEIGVILFSNQHGLLGQTKNAKELLRCLENYTE